MATDSQEEKCSNNSTKSEGNLFRCWCGNTYGPGEKFRPHFNERDQRMRAEVLAAVSKHRLDMDEGLCACGWESKGETWADHILSLQPTAKHLKGLLREEWNKAIEASCEEIEKLKQKIMLEKARASEDKG